MLKVGFIGWRGMVGSVLMERMLINQDFSKINARLFSTASAGGAVPDRYAKHVENKQLLNSYDLDQLLELDVIVATFGSNYTATILPQLQSRGYSGYFLDASSFLREHDSAVIVLDPVNRCLIDLALQSGIKYYVGGNCTVSLMLLALHGLFAADLVEAVNSMTYQAISGAGIKPMRELLQQNSMVSKSLEKSLALDAGDIIDLGNQLPSLARGFPKESIGYPLAFNLLPFIDSKMANGQTREEWKGQIEANKILGKSANKLITIDGVCVRVPTIRCHAQALMVKLKRPDLEVAEIADILASGNQWVKVIANEKEETLTNLTPMAVQATLDVAVGRLKKMNWGKEYISLFTVADQLLWGAAEPLRRMLNILIDYQ